MARPLTDAQFARLLEFRVGLRRFLQWSELQANMVGLTAAQHQLLIAIRGHAGEDGPTITDIAQYLLVRHHSAIGLINRVVNLGLVERRDDPSDQRVVRLALTPLGHDRVNALAAAHLEELRQLAPALAGLVGANVIGEPR